MLIKLLLKAGANPLDQFANEKTALIYAIMTHNQDDIKVLVQDKKQINAHDIIYGKTALMYAALLGDLTLVTLLVDNGANISAVDNLNQTALCYASVKNIFQYLIENGIDVNIVSAEYDTALLQAIRNKYFDLVPLILESLTIDVLNTKLINYVDDDSAYSYAVAQGYNLEHEPEVCNAFLHTAALLRERGANTNANNRWRIEIAQRGLDILSNPKKPAKTLNEDAQPGPYITKFFLFEEYWKQWQAQQIERSPELKQETVLEDKSNEPSILVEENHIIISETSPKQKKTTPFWDKNNKPIKPPEADQSRLISNNIASKEISERALRTTRSPFSVSKPRTPYEF